MDAMPSTDLGDGATPGYTRTHTCSHTRRHYTHLERLRGGEWGGWCRLSDEGTGVPGPWGRYAVCFRMLRAPEMSRLLPLGAAR